ncbi:MAG: GNAT family N-acetyltransferase [Pseudomonadota bacterium]|nr:GNAT family N-acetyltransferase [Pseudomonadota bacterium]
MREQGIPEALEWDGRDPACHHVIATDAKGAVIGCARLLPDGSIGRLAVDHAWRGRGVGSAILSRLIDIARNTGFERVVLDARADAEAFYAQRGFAAAGAQFIEASIRHQRTERVLSPMTVPEGEPCALELGNTR